MTKPLISVDELSKSYWIGHKSNSAPRYVALRDVAGNAIQKVAQKAKDVISGKQILQGNETEEFWALKRVSFEVNEGEVIGIIGRNGAGKSTLLKVLSRITEPTRGRVTLRGRVASLLEVGTGFHPELSGRENIFLNGAILGMSRGEIKRNLDAIIDFAGVEQFLDTPVKRYSSGMYVRLAFAVAAHLSPEVLIIDEVLAVGDAEFQKKCLSKMRKVGSDGGTVVLVSHNMGSILSLCQRCVFLRGGEVVAVGTTEDVVNSYINDNSSTGMNIGGKGVGNEKAEFIQAWAQNTGGDKASTFKLEECVQIFMDFKICKDLNVATVPNFHVYDSRGQIAFITAGRLNESNKRGNYRANCTIPPNLLNDGAYFVACSVTCTYEGVDVCFSISDAVTLNMIETIGDDINGPPRFGYVGPIPGAVRPKLEWVITPLDLATSESRSR